MMNLERLLDLRAIMTCARDASSKYEGVVTGYGVVANRVIIFLVQDDGNLVGRYTDEFTLKVIKQGEDARG